jgi:hypothetical protein
METYYNVNCPNCNALISGTYWGKPLSFTKTCSNCHAFLNIVIELDDVKVILVEKPPQVGYIPEPPPIEGKQVVLDKVIEDLKKRSEFGEKKYGTKLMTFNVRKLLIDLYQEILDAAVYIKQELMERESRKE